jgi:hypothetical protein
MNRLTRTDLRELILRVAQEQQRVHGAHASARLGTSSGGAKLGLHSGPDLEQATLTP